VPEHPQNPRQALRQGFFSSLPIVLGIVPFAVVTGISGTNIGLSAFEITMMSALMYAGASQLVALQLMSTGASLFFVVLAVIVVNLRYIMYSSALAKILSPLSKALQALAAFWLVDQNFALTLNRSKDIDPKLSSWFYLGTGLPLWCSWILFTLVGATLGTRLPESWSLDFAARLCFLVLLIPAIGNRPTLAAALVGGITATLFTFLPYRSGLFVGALAGISTGAWLEYQQETR
jgi:4-azaleucine resistance transporter AzlC